MKQLYLSGIVMVALYTVAQAQMVSYYTPYTATYCTQDAYVCPNGTTVGRSGPHCTFVCPSENIPTLTNSSYTYTSGCYTYYYNGITRTTSILSYNCYTPSYSYHYQPTQLPAHYQYYYSYDTKAWYPSTYNQSYYSFSQGTYCYYNYFSGTYSCF